LDFEKNLAAEEQEKIWGMLVDCPPENGAALDLLDDFHKSDLRGLIGDIRQDIFVIHGANDKITPVGVVELWKEAPKLRKTCIFEECGHAPFFTFPDRFNVTLGDCLEGL
jgi:pimeloyl-[acyl-carrier protein] methyl ester esterase